MQAEFGELKPLYRGWLEQQDVADTEAIIGGVAFVLTSCAMKEAATSITELSLSSLRSVLEFIGAQFPETLENTRDKMRGYLEFLDESDEFTGSDELFEELYELVDDEKEIDVAEVEAEIGSDFEPPGLFDFPPPELLDEAEESEQPDEPVVVERLVKMARECKTVVATSAMGTDEALAAMEALPMTARARALLTWIGKGKGLTGTGVLRRNDIKPAAARLGINAAGSATGSPNAYAIGMTFGVLKVSSMSDVPRLDLYWQMLRQAGLIEFQGNWVGLTEFGWTFAAKHSTSTSKAVQEMATAAYGVLAGVIPRSNGQLELSPTHVASVLISGGTSSPWSTEVVIEGTENGRPRVDLFSKTLTARVGRRVRQWADDGLVDIGKEITIPEVLLPALAMGLGKSFKFELGAPRP